PFPHGLATVHTTLHTPADAAASADRNAPAAPPLGELLGVPERAQALSRQMRERLERLRALTADREPPTVLLLIGTHPPMASGPGTVHDELLSHLGARNAAREASVSAPTYDREALLALAPDVILLLSPG